MLSLCWAYCIQAWRLPEATPPLQHPGELLRLPSVPAALLSPCSTAQQQQGGTSHASAAAANTKGAPDAVPLPLVTHSSFQPQVKHELWPSACLGAALLHRGTPPTRDPLTPSLCMALLLPGHSKHGEHKGPTSSPKELPQIQGSGAAAQVGHEERRERAALVP